MPSIRDLHDVGAVSVMAWAKLPAPSGHTTSNPAFLRSQVATGSFARSASTSIRAPVAASMMIVA
ncbi:hypothetical protein PH203_34980 [Streptomyces sp. S.PB5]|nr:hypothetical protein [Streptomyces sp. S.PB5]MDN3027037.1 hypothetical protein [Streptomyces sp. S.PB5]